MIYRVFPNYWPTITGSSFLKVAVVSSDSRINESCSLVYVFLWLWEFCGVPGAEGAPLEHARIMCTGREVGISAVRSSDPSVFSGVTQGQWSCSAALHLENTRCVFICGYSIGFFLGWEFVSMLERWAPHCYIRWKSVRLFLSHVSVKSRMCCDSRASLFLDLLSCSILRY